MNGLGEPWRVMTREEYLGLSLQGPVAVALSTMTPPVKPGTEA